MSQFSFCSAFWRRVPAFLLLLTAAALVGCGNSDPKRLRVFPVKGKVLLDGQPLANAFVVLHRKSEINLSAPTATAPSATATTDAAGEFMATTYDAKDGAPEGEYAVTVVYYELRQDGGNFEPGPNILASELSRPESTTIFVRVSANPTTLDPIVVRR